MTKLFAGSKDVTFLDVNLSEEAIRTGPNKEAWNPGAGGWPTIKYFNKETGMDGGTYKKKTDKKICDELGDEGNMVDYVEEYGKTTLCNVETEKGCNDKEIQYIAKMKTKTNAEMKAQLVRLQSMEGSKMAPSVAVYMKQRKKILAQLLAAGGTDGSPEDEL